MRRFSGSRQHTSLVAVMFVLVLGCQGTVEAPGGFPPDQSTPSTDMSSPPDLQQAPLDMQERLDLSNAPDMSTHLDHGVMDMALVDLGADAGADLGGAPEDLGPPLEDAAVILSSPFPAMADCGASLTVGVVMENTGGTTWTRADEHRLTVKDNLGIAARNNIRLAADESIAPGESHTFNVELTMPAQAQTLSVSWQMTSRDGDFGPLVQADIEVACDPMQGQEPPPPVLSQVVWLHTDVSGWAETSVLQPITFQSNLICLEYDKANVWSSDYIGETEVVGNPWIFIYNRNEQRWYAATWEWLRPGQTCKFVTSVAGDHIKRSPYDAASGWTPTSGEVYYFMISGLARANQRNAMERTNLVRLVWP